MSDTIPADAYFRSAADLAGSWWQLEAQRRAWSLVRALELDARAIALVMAANMPLEDPLTAVHVLLNTDAARAAKWAKKHYGEP